MDQTIDNTENGSVEQSQDRNYEAEASTMGWQPEDKFKGDKSRWIDAKAYVERGETVLPIVKAKLRETEAKLEEVMKTAQEFAAFNKAATEREVSEWKTKYEQVIQEKAAALTQGEGDKFVEAEARQKELEASRPQPKKDEQKVDPVFKAWMDETPWYGTDKKMTREALIIGAELAEDGLRGRALYDAVAKEVEARAQAASGTTRAGPQRGGKVAAESKGARNYENLKPEFREHCDRSYKVFGSKGTEEAWRKSWTSKAGDDYFRS